MLGKHGSEELQKKAIQGSAYILREVKVKVKFTIE